MALAKDIRHITARIARFCEEHLVADDPTEFESLSVDGLIRTYLYFRNENPKFRSPILIKEIRRRLEDSSLDTADREILTKLIAGDE